MMNIPIDVKPNELYLFNGKDGAQEYEYIQMRPDGQLVFRHRSTEKRKVLSKSDFENLRCDGTITRVVAKRELARLDSSGDLDPTTLLDPNEDGLTSKEKKRREVARKNLQMARTLRFYCCRYDESPHATKGKVSLGRLVSENFEQACLRGLTWKPSDSAIRRALLNCGSPGERPLSAFLEGRGKHDPVNRWHKATLDLKQKMIEYFWSNRTIRPCDAIHQFYHEFDIENSRRQALGEAPLSRPCKTILREWIRKEENYERYSTRYSKPEADRRFRGRSRGIQASRILEYVMVDHTKVDAVALLLDEDGGRLMAERPWLTVAIDVKSRMILGAELTFEPPSLHTVCLCLRQVVKRKTFLIDEFGEHKGATDGWGMPSTLVVENGFAEVGFSFQVLCEGAGIDVMWAPLKNPQFKSYVERFFDTLNELLWHRLECGIPHQPREMTARDLKPQQKAALTLEELRQRLWAGIVTIYHVEPHRGIGMAPARAWRRSLQQHGRPMLDDTRNLEGLIGQSHRCLLTAEGVTLAGHRFHDPEVTSRLLDSLMRDASVRDERRYPRSSGKASVLVTQDPADCSYIHVWDYRRRKNEKLPNWDQKFSVGCSWRVAKLIREYAAAQNLAFHSDEEKSAARAAYRRSLGPSMLELPSREGRKLVRPYHAEKATLVSGDEVIEGVAEATVSGLDPGDVPNSPPVVERTDSRVPPKGPRRGGAKATAKATATRRRHTSERKAKATAAAHRNSGADHQSMPEPYAPTTPVTDPTAEEVAASLALLRSLASDLD